MKPTIGEQGIPEGLLDADIRDVETITERLSGNDRPVLIIAHGLSSERIANITQLLIANQTDFGFPIAIIDGDSGYDAMADQDIINIYPEDALKPFSRDIFALSREMEIRELSRDIRAEMDLVDHKIMIAEKQEVNAGRYPGEAFTKRQRTQQMKRGNGKRGR